MSNPKKDPKLLPQLQGAREAEVVGSDGDKVGELKRVRADDFLVDRSMRRDVYVPVNGVKELTDDNRIVLDIPADQVDEMDWPKPSILGSEPEPSHYFLRKAPIRATELEHLGTASR
jgi:Uncharacterized protein conserved in bacteria (DUF2171)